MAETGIDVMAELAEAHENLARQEAALFEELRKCRDELKSSLRGIRILLYVFTVLLLITNPKLVELLGRVLGIIK